MYSQCFIKMSREKIHLNIPWQNKRSLTRGGRCSGATASLQRMPRWGQLDPFKLYQPCSYVPATNLVVWCSCRFKTRGQMMGNIFDRNAHVGHVFGSQEHNLWPHVIRMALASVSTGGRILVMYSHFTLVFGQRKVGDPQRSRRILV